MQMRGNVAFGLGNSWFNENQSWIMSDLALVIEYLLKYALFIIFSFSSIISLCIIYRILKLKLATRIKPEANRAILITGATAGFGLVLAKHFYELGFSVFAGYYNENEDGFSELKSKYSQDDTGNINRHCAQHLFLIKMDVRSQSSIDESSEQISNLMKKHGLRLHCLINNAGIAKTSPFEWISRSSIEDVVDTNLKGAMLVTKNFIIELIKSKGRVINVTSGTYLFPGPGYAAYGTTKGGINAFSELLDEDLKPYGAMCRCVMPGNYISVSNIIYSQASCCHDSLSKLTEEERKVFKRTIISYSKVIDGRLRKKLQHYDRSTRAELANNYRFNLPNFEGSSKNIFSRLSDCLFLAIGFLDGRSSNLDKDLVVAFESAVCLKDPPRRLYAGNWLYANLLGPSIEYLPPILLANTNKLINCVMARA